MPRQRHIPCEDVPNTTVQLERRGYRVLGNAPTPGMPGFCTLEFESPARTPAMASFAAVSRAVAAPAPDGPLEPLQELAAKAIINIFESSEVLGKYGQVTVIEGDSGRLTFGRSQTTLTTGNLWRLLKTYCEAPGARFAGRLTPYLPELEKQLAEVDKDLRLHNLLRATADDPVMREVQDRFFDDFYWVPTIAKAAQAQIHSALGIAVVYDSTVHGSWELIRTRTIQQYGAISAAFPEQEWIKAYIKTRREWLAKHARHDLRRTVYRMDTLQALADHAQWSLDLPLLVRGKEISLKTLFAPPPDCYDGPALGSRSLAVTTPLARGADVRLVQLGLSDAGIRITADGVYGNASAAAVDEYVTANGLPSSGMADKSLIMHIAGHG